MHQKPSVDVSIDSFDPAVETALAAVQLEMLASNKAIEWIV